VGAWRLTVDLLSPSYQARGCERKGKMARRKIPLVKTDPQMTDASRRNGHSSNQASVINCGSIGALSSSFHSLWLERAPIGHNLSSSARSFFPFIILRAEERYVQKIILHSSADSFFLWAQTRINVEEPKEKKGRRQLQIHV